MILIAWMLPTEQRENNDFLRTRQMGHFGGPLVRQEAHLVQGLSLDTIRPSKFSEEVPRVNHDSALGRWRRTQHHNAQHFIHNIHDNNAAATSGGKQ